MRQGGAHSYTQNETVLLGRVLATQDTQQVRGRELHLVLEKAKGSVYAAAPLGSTKRRQDCDRRAADRERILLIRISGARK